jgi:hypothetical protein
MPPTIANVVFFKLKANLIEQNSFNQSCEIEFARFQFFSNKFQWRDLVQIKN